MKLEAPSKKNFPKKSEKYSLTSDTPLIDSVPLFREEETLGFHYQHMLKDSLVYSRVMGWVSEEQWIKLITCPENGDMFSQKIKYISGLFNLDLPTSTPSPPLSNLSPILPNLP